MIGCALTSSWAVDIGWGNGAGDLVVDPSGTELGAADTYTFELGSFDAGFKPTVENTLMWVDHWTALDSSAYAVDTGMFGGTVTLDAGNAGPFAGSQAFVWAYDERIGSEGTIVEWAIYTLLGSPQSWVFPDPDEAGVPGMLDYALGDADFFLFGSRMGIEGGGLQLKAQNVALRATIPEPSVAGLSLTGAAALLLLARCRRRRW